MALTISNTSFLVRDTIYHLDATSIPINRSPITTSSKLYTETDILAMKCYYDTYLKPLLPALTSLPTSHPTHPLLEIQSKLEETGILLKHPEVKSTIQSLLTEQTSKKSATEVHYNKLTTLFQHITPCLTSTEKPSTIYELLSRSTKSFIRKINLQASIPLSPPSPYKASMTRAYSTFVPNKRETFSFALN